MRYVLPIASLLWLTACSELRPVTGPVPTGKPLLVRFERSTEVRLIAPGDTGRMVVLREIRGQSRGVSGDTVRLVVTRARDANGEEVYSGSTAIVKLGPDVRVETVRFDTDKTILVVAGSIALGAIAYGVLYMLAYMTCNNC